MAKPKKYPTPTKYWIAELDDGTWKAWPDGRENVCVYADSEEGVEDKMEELLQRERTERNAQSV